MRESSLKGSFTWRSLLIWMALFCVSPAIRAAQGGEDEAGPRIYRDRVDPHWFDGNRKFWYRVQTGREQFEYILVDAGAGVRERAFDHAALAAALQKSGVTNAQSDNLNLRDLSFENSGCARFRVGGKEWLWNHTSAVLNETTDTNRAADEASLETNLRASVRTGEETSLTFINRSGWEVRLFWLDSEGERRPYGKLSEGESRAQHTFAGHVWLAMNAGDETLGVWEAQEDGGTIEISRERAANSRSPRRDREGTRRGASDMSIDGHWRAFSTNHNLCLMNLQTGTRTMLTSDGTGEDGYDGRIYWSPDSTKLLGIRTRKGDERKVYLVESSPRDQIQPRLQSYDYLKPGDRVAVSKPHLFEVAKNCEIPIEDALFANPWSNEDFRWNPDSSRFTFVFNQRGHQVLRVVSVDAATGKTSAIIDEQSRTFIDYSGKYFAEFLYRTNSEGAIVLEIIWMSERDGWNHLYLYDGLTGEVKNQITRGEWVVRGVDRVDAAARQIWFRAGGIRPEQDPYYVHYCRVNFDGTGLTILTEGDGTHRARFSDDNRLLIDTWSRVDRPPVNELRRASDGRLICKLEEADASEWLACGKPYPGRFVAKGRDGKADIYGVIHWPQEREPGRKYPVIESIYAGPQGAFVPKAFQSRAPELTRHGFVVVQIDGMGTSQRSKAFHDLCWKNLADAGFPDRILWLKAAAAAHPNLDLSRVGIYGTSAGGQSALGGLLMHPEVYKAAVADCGCHDNRMDKIWWNEQWMGWPIGAHYEEQSNVTMAHRLQGKLLLMVGELDRNVDPASTMQVANALIKAGKDFEFLVVPGAGHGVLGSPYSQRRLLDFFRRNL
jgi:dipeptidyl aminopeptidase/acylaminoacyl peptidase